MLIVRHVRKAFYSATMLVALASIPIIPNAEANTLEEFAAAPGYSLEIDSKGFFLPTAIAFVPNPDSAPDAPLYFVTELKGAIKVVTNDRTVHTFATVPSERKQGPDLDGDSQSGLAGLCLDQTSGYVFATYTEVDPSGILRNRIIRFTSKPGAFNIAPNGAQRIDAMLVPFQSAPAHQVGNCLTENGRLLVGVGDGGNVAAASAPNVLLGKVLCMDFDGNPCAGNPLVQSPAPVADDKNASIPPEAFVYAHGFRNPFSLALVENELFVADNGVKIDRLVRVMRGRDHLWRGTDQSLAAHADVVFVPSFSPVQLTYVPVNSNVIAPDHRGAFVAAAFGGELTAPGVVAFRRPTAEKSSVPGHLLEYVGSKGQRFAAVALGPDGLYTAPLVPGPDGTSSVLRLRYAPERAHAVVVKARFGLEPQKNAGALGASGCLSCHKVEGGGGGIGPSLDEFGLLWRLTKRLNSAEYKAQVLQVDALETEPFTGWREARQEVLAQQGTERTWVWMKHFLKEPRFDNPNVQMPNLVLSDAQIEQVRAELAGKLRDQPLTRVTAFAQRNSRPLLIGAIGGAGLIFSLGVVILLLVWLRARRLRASPR